MFAQFFGNYLLSHNVVTKEQLLDAMQKMSSSKVKLGTLAIHAGYMTADEVDRIFILQTHQDKQFGELAVQEGYLTDEQVAELVKKQNIDYLTLGQVLLDEGILDNTELQNYIIDYQSENELYDFDYTEETKDSIQQMIEKFFVVTERALSVYEKSYLRLLFHSLIRFIGEDFTLVTPSICKEYPVNHCVSQKIVGTFSMNTYLDMPQATCIEFASRYVGDSFSEFDEYVQSSVEDFLNLHNGLFNVNVSNEYSVELELTPPAIEQDELLTFENNAYLIPIIYPFGTIHVIIEFIDKSSK
jgi:CheY-specific phosphatase CheX